MSNQTYFVWTNGGRSVSVAGSFTGWGQIPMIKQGNYFFTSLSLDDGVYHYKFVVDGVWSYDLGQPHEDDGSGNWNNYVELPNCTPPPEDLTPEPVVEHKAKVAHVQKAPAHVAPAPAHDDGEEKPLSKKQQKKQAKLQDKAQRKEQKHHPKPEPESEVVAEEEPAVAVEEEEAEVVVPEAKPAKTAETVVVIDVVASDVDTDMTVLEAFVRSVQPEGLKWEGSSVSEYVFGLKKLTIICKCRDDVSVEEVVCQELEKNEMVGSAQIQSFAC